MSSLYSSAIQPALATPYDNTVTALGQGDVQTAIDQLAGYANAAVGEGLFGDGSDGALSMASGTLVLSRTMYYVSITLTGTAIINTNGFKIYCKGTINISGTSAIIRTPNNGAAGSGQTAGSGGIQITANDMGTGLAGQAGSQGAAGGLGGAGGVAGAGAGTSYGYGGAGGASGSSGSGAAGAAGTYTNVPERIIRHDHILLLAYKNGGQGGAGGAGGSASAFGTAGGGGGGGSGGAVIMIFTLALINTSSVGITCLGGNGGNGGTGAGGNANGGGGGGGGGGGQIYVVTINSSTIGTLNVSGGSGGTGGAPAGSGAAGNAGSAGSVGHTAVFNAVANTWTYT